MENKKVGIIGGTGFESPQFFQLEEELFIETTYGFPDSPLASGKISGVDVVLLSRHGKKHLVPPTQVNNRANIQALKEVGCTHILATTACGSLREEIRRGELVIPDQLIDFTRHRINTFYDRFEAGKLKHTPMADPFDASLRKILTEKAISLDIPFHASGTVITIEGPRFSTRAESRMFRTWGADIVNMSIAPEAALAHEAGIPYAVVAMSTDYDSWREDGDVVEWEGVLEVFRKNVHRVKELIKAVVPAI